MPAEDEEEDFHVTIFVGPWKTALLFAVESSAAHTFAAAALEEDEAVKPKDAIVSAKTLRR